jgi:hypothetical protein
VANQSGVIVVSVANYRGFSSVVAFRPQSSPGPRSVGNGESSLIWNLINQVEQVAALRLEGSARRFARISESPHGGDLVLPIVND